MWPCFKTVQNYLPSQKNATPIDIDTKELHYSIFYFYEVAVLLQNFEISYGILYFIELIRKKSKMVLDNLNYAIKKIN